jgi:hypothetical protein
MESRRIFIGLREIAGYNAKLKQGFEELGIRCTYLNQHAHPFNFEETESSNFILRFQRWANSRLDTCKSLPEWIFYNSIIQILNIPLFIWVLTNHDVFIFCYNSTFLAYYDLPILRFFKKK